MAFIFPQHWQAGLPFAILLGVKVGPSLWRALRTPAPPIIRAAVHAGIVSLIVLDATLAAIFGGIVLGAAVLSLSVMTGELARPVSGDITPISETMRSLQQIFVVPFTYPVHFTVDAFAAETCAPRNIG